MLTEILTGEEAKKKIDDGVKLLTKAVGSTLGALGSPVAFANLGNTSLITKDGVTVAKKIRIEDKFERIGAQSLQEVCVRLLNKVGDGTTTSCVLTAALLEELRLANLTPHELKQFKKLTNKVIDYVKSISIQDVDEEKLAGVAYISSNGDEEITGYLREAFNHVGKDGSIMVQQINSSETFVVPEDGALIPFGWGHPSYCINLQKQSTVIDNAYLLLIDEQIPQWQNLMDILGEMQSECHPLPPKVLIVSRGMMSDTRANCIGNILQKRLIGAEIEISGGDTFTADLFADLAILTGNPIIGKQYNLPLAEDGGVTLSQLRKIKLFKTTADSTLIVPEEFENEPLTQHIAYLNEMLNTCTDDKEKGYIASRIARLSQKICQIKVGGGTPQTISEKLDRIDDAVCAVRVAQQEGVMPGGGSIFLHLMHAISEIGVIEACDESLKLQMIIKNVFTKFLATLYKNSSYHQEKFKTIIKSYEDFRDQISDLDSLSKIFNKNIWDMLFHQECDKFSSKNPKEWNYLNIANDDGVMINLFENSILDATKVITESLAAAVDQATLLSQVDTLIAFSDKDDPHFFNPMEMQREMEQNILKQNYQNARY